MKNIYTAKDTTKLKDKKERPEVNACHTCNVTGIKSVSGI